MYWITVSMLSMAHYFFNKGRSLQILPNTGQRPASASQIPVNRLLMSQIPVRQISKQRIPVRQKPTSQKRL